MLQTWTTKAFRCYILTLHASLSQQVVEELPVSCMWFVLCQQHAIEYAVAQETAQCYTYVSVHVHVQTAQGIDL